MPNTYSAFLVKYHSFGPTMFIDDLMGAEDLVCYYGMSIVSVVVVVVVVVVALGDEVHVVEEGLATILLHVADISSEDGVPESSVAVASRTIPRFGRDIKP